MDRIRPTGPAVLPLAVGDEVRLRRRHPCGGDSWRVTRIGADIGITCATCGRHLMLERRDLERRAVAVVRPGSDEGVGG